MLGHHRHASLGNLPSQRLASLLSTRVIKDVQDHQFATVLINQSTKNAKLSLHTKVASDCCTYTKNQSSYGNASKIQGDVVASDDSDNDSVPDLTTSPTSSESLSLPDFDDFKGAVDCPEVISENEDAPIAYGSLVGLESRQIPKRRAIFTLGDEEDADADESTREGGREQEVQSTGRGLRRQTVGKEASLNLNKWFKQGRI